MSVRWTWPALFIAFFAMAAPAAAMQWRVPDDATTGAQQQFVGTIERSLGMFYISGLGENSRRLTNSHLPYAAPMGVEVHVGRRNAVWIHYPEYEMTLVLRGEGSYNLYDYYERARIDTGTSEGRFLSRLSAADYVSRTMNLNVHAPSRVNATQQQEFCRLKSILVRGWDETQDPCQPHADGLYRESTTYMQAQQFIDEASDYYSENEDSPMIAHIMWLQMLAYDIVRDEDSLQEISTIIYMLAFDEERGRDPFNVSEQLLFLYHTAIVFFRHGYYESTLDSLDQMWEIYEAEGSSLDSTIIVPQDISRACTLAAFSAQVMRQSESRQRWSRRASSVT